MKPMRIMRGSRSCRLLRPFNLLGRIAVSTEDLVGLRLWRPTKKRVDVLPDDFALRCDLEKSSEHPLIDERIAVRQPLCIRNSGAEKICWELLLEFSRDAFRPRIDFEHARERQRLVQAMRAIVK